MTEKSLTLLEIHLGDGDVRIAPNGLLGGTDGDAGESDGPDGNRNGTDTDDADGSTSGFGCGCSVAKVLAAVGLLAVVAVAVARLFDADVLDDAEALDALGE